MKPCCSALLRSIGRRGEPAISTDERSGFPVISVGRQVTSEQAVTALDDDRDLAAAWL